MENFDDTKKPEYTERLLKKQGKWWKKVLDVQMPYRYNIKKICHGFVLDVGCGVGRNLMHLNGNGVGVDHNTASIEIAKSRGLTVFSASEFEESSYKKEEFFDSILLAHVLEHMDEKRGFEILSEYFPSLKKMVK